MILKKDISVAEFLGGISSTSKGSSMISGLLKSIGSQRKNNKKPTLHDSIQLEKVFFTDYEVQAAIIRICKSNYSLNDSYKNLFATEEDLSNDQFSPFIATQPFESYWVTLLKAILGIVFPKIVYSENYNPCTGKDEDLQFLLREYEYEFQQQILADLYCRKVIRILRNVLSGLFSLRKLLSVQTHLKKVLYEYFDIVFSLKDVVTKNRFTINFITTLLFTNDEERKNIRYIPATRRT